MPGRIRPKSLHPARQRFLATFTRRKAHNDAPTPNWSAVSTKANSTSTRPPSHYHKHRDDRWKQLIPTQMRPETYKVLSYTFFLGGVLYLITHTVASSRCANGPSMLPTLNVWSEEGGFEFVLVSYLHRRGRGICVGDIISFYHPVRRGHVAMKRVVAMPGDFVLRDTPGEGNGTLIQVPEGHCWVAGDNLEWSRDSRHYGPLPLALVRGKAIGRLKPERKLFKDALRSVDAP